MDQVGGPGKWQAKANEDISCCIKNGTSGYPWTKFDLNFFYDHFFQFYSPPLLKFLNVPNFILFKQQRHKVFVPYINKFNINKQYMNLNQSWLIAGNTLLMANVTSIKINKTLECMFINTSEGLH